MCGFAKNNVVLVEAKGSLSRTKARSKPIQNLANAAFNEQVRHYINADDGNVVVAGGFAIAFGAVPDSGSSNLAVASPHLIAATPTTKSRRVSYSLSAAAMQEVQIQRPAKQQQQQEQQEQQEREEQQEQHEKSPSPDYEGPRGPHDGGPRDEGGRSQPNGRVAYANYETVFRLCGAWQAASALRRVLDGSVDESVPETQEFYVFEDGGRKFLIGSHQERLFWPDALVFAVFQPSAEAVLKSLVNNPSHPPESVSIAVAPFDDDLDESPGIVTAMQGDGFALASAWEFRADRRVWDLRRGGWI